jgi:hypothetical protein
MSRAEIMREMRLVILRREGPAIFQPSLEFPRVYGVLMDWPIHNAIVTVVSFASGDASIYTTGTFGIIGGIGHEKVRVAAKLFVNLAER